MTWNEWEAIASMLVAAYPRQEVPTETVAVYYHRLCRYDAVEVCQAVEAAIDGSRWFPTISEIRERIPGVALDPASRRVAAEYGRYTGELPEPTAATEEAQRRIRQMLEQVGRDKPVHDLAEERRKRRIAEEMMSEAEA